MIGCRKPLFHRVTRISAIALLLAMTVHGARAAISGSVVTLPRVATGATTPNPSGLSLTIDARWAPACGYRPVRVTVNQVMPATTERRLTLRFVPISNTPNIDPDFCYQTSAEVAVPSALSGAALLLPNVQTVYVPQHFMWQALRLDVFEDGQRVPELSADDVLGGTDLAAIAGAAGGGYGYGIGWQPTAMLLTADTKALGPSPNLALPGVSNAVCVLPVVLANNNAPPSGWLAASALPENWLCYLGIDRFVISWPELQEFAGRYPAQWGAIRRAVSAGATLIVADLPPESRDSFCNWLGAEDKKDGKRAWSWTWSKNRAVIPQGKGVDPKLDFADMPWQCGRITAASDSLSYVLQQLPESQDNWDRRFGMGIDPGSLGGNRADFWLWLVPGVGLTPVLQFQVLITLFVVVIGPVTFYFLKRWQRLNLLVFTAPVTALLVTALLVGYAVLSDGLGLRVRARTFTQIDQRRGEAVCWSRLSYYGGLTPWQPARFSGETAVFPYRQVEFPQNTRGTLPTRRWNWAPRDPERRQVEGELEQRLSPDWIPARTPTQFLCVRSRPTKARLDVRPTADGGLEVTNRLGTTIRDVVVLDASGRRYAGHNIAVTQTAPLLADKDITYDPRAELKPPGNVSPEGLHGSRYRSGSYYYGNSNVSAPQDAGVLETSLGRARELAPRHYLAIVDRSPEAELGIDSAQEQGSLHVIVGDW